MAQSLSTPLYDDLTDQMMAALHTGDYAYESHVSITYDRIEQAARTPVPHAFLQAFEDA